MTAPNRLNLWMAATTVERDGLAALAGVNPGDFCLVQGTNLYVLDLSSSWQPIAGVPTEGPLAVGARNEDDTLFRAIFVMTSVPHRAVLDQPPSSVTLVVSGSLNWPTANLTAVPVGVTGLYFYGDSDPVAPGAVAAWRGSYIITI